MSWSRRAVLGGLGAWPLAGCSGLGSEHSPPRIPSELEVTLPTSIRGALDRGPRLRLIEDHGLPLVAMAVAVHRGTRDDPPTHAGLASVVADLLVEGMEGEDRVDLLERYGELGTTPRVSVTPSRILLSCTVHRDYAAAALRLMVENLRHATLGEEAFERIRREHAEALEGMRGEPATIVGMGILLGALGIEPASACLPRGAIGPLNALTLADVRGWSSARMRPDDMSILLSGDLVQEEALRWAGDAVRGWPLAATPVPAPAPVREPGPGRPRIVFVRWPAAPQALIAVGGLREPAGHPREPAQTFANGIIGGFLHRQLRTRQRTSYGVRSRTWGTVGGPVRQQWAKLESVDSGRAVQRLWTYLLRLERETVEIHPESLDNMRTATIAAMLASYQGADAGLRLLVSLASEDLPPSAPAERLARVRELDADAVSLELRRLYHPDRARMCVVGNDDVIVQARKVLPEDGAVVRELDQLFGVASG